MRAVAIRYHEHTFRTTGWFIGIYQVNNSSSVFIETESGCVESYDLKIYSFKFINPTGVPPPYE